MKKFLLWFFVSLGVLFFIILLGVAYLVVFDPLNLKPLLFPPTSAPVSPLQRDGGTPTPATPTTKKLPITETQKKVLETVGINPDTLPSSFTPAQEACFVEKLGAARVAQIKGGAAPTPTEIYTARVCLGSKYLFIIFLIQYKAYKPFNIFPYAKNIPERYHSRAV